MATDVEVIWVKRTPEYFCEGAGHATRRFARRAICKSQKMPMDAFNYNETTLQQRGPVVSISMTLKSTRYIYHRR
jgi:hypothetical protein